MSNFHELPKSPILKRIEPPHESMTARVIETGEITAGIAVPEHGGVRFYSSDRTFDALDGHLFRNFEQANRAARERVRPHGRGLQRRATPRIQAI